MELIKPFTSASQAIDVLDNGGEFYNIFTKADDDIISPSEVGKIAGVAFQKKRAVSYLQLALSKLSTRERLEVEGRFDDKLADTYQKYQADELTTLSAVQSEEIGTNVLIKGIVNRIEEDGFVTGYVQIPIVDTFAMIPITETYSVYKLNIHGNDSGILIAHSKDEQGLPEGQLTIAGIIHEFQIEENEHSKTEKFIEVNYYMQ